MPQPGTGATHYYAKLGAQEKGRAIKGLVVCNGWDVSYRLGTYYKDLDLSY